MYFDELDLNDNVLDALYDMHFDVCTPVQEKCIPEILEGKDVLGVAQTGTGKTAAYLLPILSKLDDGGYPKDAINCVIMSPTRELAQQIDQAMQGFGYYLQGVSSVPVYGGNDGNRYDQELKSLTMGADVVIATPGRLISHISMGNADFSKVSFFVLDEADRMLDMGFSEDIKKIAKELPADCQTIMFSATMPDKIEELAKTLLKNPVEIKLAVSKPAEKIKQSAYVCYETQKLGIIKDIFKKGDLQRVIIFSGKKQKVKQINRALIQLHINSGEMHSDLEQAERDQILHKFKSGQIDVLVATDIVARGIDIDDVAMVINFDVPHDAEDYVHRIGRTARADRDGSAITLVSDDEIGLFKQIEKFLEKEVEKNALPEALGEGPDYAAGGKGQRSSAKSRRRKDRDATAHKHKPRRTEGERKPKERTEKADKPQGEKPSAEQKQPKERRQPRDKQQPKPQGAEATQTEKVNAEGGQQDNKNKSRRRNNGQPRKQDEGAKQTGQPNQNAPKQNSDKANNNRQRNKQQSSAGQQNAKPRRQKQQQRQQDAKPKHQEENYQPAKMSPVVNPSKDGAIKSMLKKPLNWIKSLGKK